MDDEAFKKEVFLLGGTPQEFFEHPELLDLFLPILKNDFRIAETVATGDEIHPLDTDISILTGKQDDLSPEQIAGWQMHTRKTCRPYFFEGGHFFSSFGEIKNPPAHQYGFVGKPCFTLCSA